MALKRIARARDFNPHRSIGATFQPLPGASFDMPFWLEQAEAELHRL